MRLAGTILAVLAATFALGGPPSRAQVPTPVTPLSPMAASRNGGTAAVAVEPSQGRHALTREDLEPWLDGVMPYALRRGDVAGAVVVVVKDGQVLLQKGYGYADSAKRTPVFPETTMFRTGSIGKLFTWTAVMQQVEQGRIDLDRDVNDYLDFKIPARFGKPITMRNLMQHTAGFEDVAKFLFVDKASSQLTIEQFLKRHVPARIFPPGETPAYSNYGATLAGYIVQRVSGEPYAQYVERHIFAPLGMTHSTEDQPLPARFAGEISKGYLLGSGPAQPFELVNVSPAGGASNSGADMARFMLAHLGDGRLGAAQILRPETAQQMHRQSFQALPPLPGFALGFYHEDRNGHQVIAHEGDTNFFHSNLELLVNDQVGVFIAVNSLGKDGSGKVVRNAVYENFMDRYFPAPPTGPEPTVATAKADAALLAGDYQLTRRMQTTLPDFIYVLGQNKIIAAPDGSLTVTGIDTIGGAPKHWREVGRFLWRDEQGHDRMAAKVVDGKVKAVWFDETVPAFLLEPVPPSQNKAWIVPLFAAALLILAMAVVAWPWQAIVRARQGRAFAHKGARAMAYRLVRLAALADLVFAIGLLFTLTTMLSGAIFPDSAHDGALRFFQLFGVVGLIGVLAGFWNVAATWRDEGASWWAKLTSVALLVSLAAVSFLGVHLHLLNWSLDF